MSYGTKKNSIKHTRHLMHAALDNGVEKKLTADEITKRLDEREARVDAYAQRNGVQPKAFEKPWVAARAFGRAEDGWTRELAHHMVHGNDAAGAFRSVKTEGPDAPVLYMNRPNDSNLVVAGLTFAARSLIHSAAAAAQIFSWGNTVLGDLLERVNALDGEKT